jgi:hypothetical protein
MFPHLDVPGMRTAPPPAAACCWNADGWMWLPLAVLPGASSKGVLTASAFISKDESVDEPCWGLRASGEHNAEDPPFSHSYGHRAGLHVAWSVRAPSLVAVVTYTRS